MIAPYLAHFALTEPPFSKEIPDANLWLPASKQVVVDALLEALEERASVVLVGEPGVGKTCVLRALRHRIPAIRRALTRTVTRCCDSELLALLRIRSTPSST